MSTIKHGQREAEAPLEKDTMRRVARRLLPIIIVCYLIAYIDRSNVSIAALTMNHDIGLTAAAYGLGAGLFFATYIIFEIPSNLALSRFGARRWIARIMITWGIVAGCMALVQGPTSFNTVRLLLGAAEAGFTPGMVYYLSQWFPSQHRGRALARLYVGAAMATVIGAPISGLILKMDGFAGLAGWKWLFVIEAIPAILLGFFVLKFFTDQPRDATWLPAQQREWLTTTLAEERHAVETQRTFTVRSALTNPGILLLALFFFFYSFDSIGLTLWMPQVIKGTFGVRSNLTTSLLTAVPYLFAVVLMLAVARSMDRRGHPHLHMAVPMTIAGVLLALSVPAGATLLGFLLLAISTGFAWSAVPALWESATAFTTGMAAAAGVALVNAVANIAGLSVPPVIGRVKDATGSFGIPLFIIAAALIAGAAVALISRRFTTPGKLADQVASSPESTSGGDPITQEHE
jgi:ACS family tartrate transporter-like MFS transporter